jgi:hypothetical protein
MDSLINSSSTAIDLCQPKSIQKAEAASALDTNTHLLLQKSSRSSLPSENTLTEKRLLVVSDCSSKHKLMG